ncbi:YkgJ family cysteine cluster protein [Deinococcus taeanensis]|uniref:YkgJ family cysteine cluster protein n=1 Tax=Deinococcus taeanensis TaxID=2737050 RepID=UPI001CDB61C0|nr:YkgJ family cysteine cluster protein [Deinococcus taeanensis]UBV43636.1 YkgJ family cysteine cluster protein [Deinococcus taeanensis]
MLSSPVNREVTAAVRRAYERYETQSRSWMDRYARQGGRVYCAAGCVACCNMPIRVSLAEALVMAEALDDALAAAMEAHARAAVANARTARDDDEYVHRHREQVGFCPVLDRHSGGCSRYESRPTRCRDTFSAFPAHFCEAGVWERMTRREKAEYRREVARTPGTDGELHFIAPLEHMSEPVWAAASRAMQDAWGTEVWGDYWVLTTLARDERFMAAVAGGDTRSAWQRASGRGLAHRSLLEFA